MSPVRFCRSLWRSSLWFCLLQSSRQIRRSLADSFTHRDSSLTRLLLIGSDGFIQQHPAEDGQRFRRVGQLAGDEVNADCVALLHRQNDVEDSQSSGDLFGLGHGLLQAFRLIPGWIHPGHACVGLGQHGLNLYVLVAREDAAEEVLPTDWSCEVTWRMETGNKEYLMLFSFCVMKSSDFIIPRWKLSSTMRSFK